MRIIVQAVVQDDDGTTKLPSVLAVIDRDRNSDPASGLGLFLREAHSLLKALQAVALGHQFDQFSRAVRRCRGCDRPLVRKDTKFLIYRTAFGKARIPSPRHYSRCATCGTMADSAATFSALARALPERVHPQWKWLQCRYASVMSFKPARTFLRDAFPGGATLPCSSVKATVRATGNRLDGRLARHGIGFVAEQSAGSRRRGSRLSFSQAASFDSPESHG